MTWEARINPSPFTVRVKAGPPAMAEVGLMPLPLVEMPGETAMTGKATALESAMPGVDTVMGAEPSMATRETGMVAVNWVALTNLVTSGVRTHWTVEPWTKRSPVTVRVTAGPPATADGGVRVR